MRGWCGCRGTPDAPRRARGYSHREDLDPLGLAPMTDNEYFVFAEGMAAGGYYATAEDYLRFAAALRRGLLLSVESQTAAFTTSPHSPAPCGYGLGFQLLEYGGKPTWGHGGGGRYGIGTHFATFADGSWTVAVMGNRDLELATQVLAPLLTFLARQHQRTRARYSAVSTRSNAERDPDLITRNKYHSDGTSTHAPPTNPIPTSRSVIARANAQPHISAPTAKRIAVPLLQRFARSSHTGSPVVSHFRSASTISAGMPMPITAKMMWKPRLTAIWVRAAIRSDTVWDG